MIYEAIKRELYSKSLYEFVKEFWQECDPAKFKEAWLVEYYCELFMWIVRKNLPERIRNTFLNDEDFKKIRESLKGNVQSIRDKDTNLHNINVPPRHTKSMIFNVLGPVWLFTMSGIKVASVSHTETLAINFNLKRQKIIESTRFKKIYPHIKLSNSSGKLLIGEHKGELYSINMSSFTGYGADLIINDDIVGAEAARKDKDVLRNAVSYYRDTLPSRINDIETGNIMNIQQRLSPGDITGYLMSDVGLARAYSFTVIKAIAEEDQTIVFPCSGKLIKLKVGDYLWPERFGDYTKLKTQVGDGVFLTQYQQNPLNSDKTVIKEEYIRYEPYETIYEDLKLRGLYYASHDFPVKDKDTSDNLGSVKACKLGGNLYILDALEKKQEYIRSKKYVVALANAQPGIIQIIEDKANGAPLLNELSSEVPGLYGYNPGTNSKYQRLELASVYMETGNVIFVTRRGKLSDSLTHLKNQLTQYPFVVHDDIVDSFSQLVNFVFADRKFMVYNNSFTEKNLINNYDWSLTALDVGVVREGNIWKAVKVAIDYYQDSFIVKEELVFKADEEEARKKLAEFSKDARMIIDCSLEQNLSNVFLSYLPLSPLPMYDLTASVNQLSLGFTKKKVLINNSCDNFVRDLENFKWNKSALEKGEEKYNGNDGMVGCLRGVIMINKGAGAVFI